MTRKISIYIMVISLLLVTLPGCSLGNLKTTKDSTSQSTAVTEETATTTTSKADITTPAETNAPSSIMTSVTPSPTESCDISSNAQILTGTFQGVEWGDYMHISIKGDDGVDYSFFVLHSIGMDPETLVIGQAVKVTWQNSDVFLDPPGETINIDQIISMELLGSTP